jgi:hypothetical protein
VALGRSAVERPVELWSPGGECVGLLKFLLLIVALSSLFRRVK